MTEAELALALAVDASRFWQTAPPYRAQQDTHLFSNEGKIQHRWERPGIGPKMDQRRFRYAWRSRYLLNSHEQNSGTRLDPTWIPEFRALLAKRFKTVERALYLPGSIVWIDRALSLKLWEASTEKAAVVLQIRNGMVTLSGTTTQSPRDPAGKICLLPTGKTAGQDVQAFYGEWRKTAWIMPPKTIWTVAKSTVLSAALYADAMPADPPGLVQAIQDADDW